ncbi:MAG: hypothetical protein ACK44U_06960, partial [Sphingobacteriales bacterium]
SQTNVQDQDEISLKELVQNIREWIAYFKTQWWKIVLAGLFGGGLGYVYAWMQPVTYTAKTTFVVEDAKSGGGLSGLASLAGQFGVDLGSNAGGGLISGENILLYFKSESLIRDVLISSWDKHTSFADQYIDVSGMRKAWDKKEDWRGFKIPIKGNGRAYSRRADSVLQTIIQQINKKELQISKVDKKASFIELSATMKHEEFAKRFTDQLLHIAIGQYVGLKTDRQKRTVEKLQERADSIARLLNQKTSTSASLQTAVSTMDMNPMYRTSTTVKTEQTMRDKTMLGSIYVEVVKNLEMAKFTLSQETPVIQIVN